MNSKPRIKLSTGTDCSHVREILENYSINTVCSEAACPNQTECYSTGSAAFLILGKKCTRNCSFCQIGKGTPPDPDPDEPARLADAVSDLKLKHVVITSVSRDDLTDGGAGHFADSIKQIREKCNSVTIEVLIPDFQGSRKSLETVINAKPDIINHNMETVRRLYPDIRPQADYDASLNLISSIKKISPGIYTKSGIMLGLGETGDEIISVIDDLKNHGCDFLTIGQYLQPSENCYQVQKYLDREVFKKYGDYAYSIGFNSVASDPLVRSSYKASDILKCQ